MRRSLPLLLIASILPLGCGENQAAKESREARAEFERVINVVEQVKLGYLPSEKGLAELKGKTGPVKFDAAPVVEAMKAKNLRGYQAALIAQAEGELKSLVTKGQTSQRVAAQQLLANLYLTTASFERRNAMKASDSLSDPAASIETFLTGIERSTGLIGRFTSDDKPVVDKWSKNKDEVAAALTKLTTEMNALQAEIDGLQTQIDAQGKARDEAFKKASGLRAEAFPKKGQENFDLQIKAIEADREGNAANTKVDELTVARDLAKAKLAIVSREQGLVQAWSQTLTTGLGAAGDRQKAMAAFDKTITDERAATVKRMVDDFTAMSANHTKAVDAKLDAALTGIAAAIDALKKADAMAVGEGKIAVKMDLLVALMAKLNTEADAIVAAGRFGSIGDQVVTRASSIGEAAAFAPAIEAVKKRLATLTEESKKTAGEILALASDASLNTNKDDALSLARATSLKNARDLATAHNARLAVHAIGARAGATTPEPTPPAP